MRATASPTSHAFVGNTGTRKTHRNNACNVNPEVMQDVIVGSAVATAVSAAVFNGLKGDTAEMCDLCQGIGGARCFVCQGSGKRDVPLEELQAANKRQFGNLRQCKPCQGTGLIACSKCRGLGFTKGL